MYSSRAPFFPHKVLDFLSALKERKQKFTFACHENRVQVGMHECKNTCVGPHDLKKHMHVLLFMSVHIFGK